MAASFASAKFLSVDACCFCCSHSIAVVAKATDISSCSTCSAAAYHSLLGNPQSSSILTDSEGIFALSCEIAYRRDPKTKSDHIYYFHTHQRQLSCPPPSPPNPSGNLLLVENKRRKNRRLRDALHPAPREGVLPTRPRVVPALDGPSAATS